MRELAQECACHAPSEAIYLIATTPLSYCVAVFAETLKAVKKMDPSKVIGVTSLDVACAQVALAKQQSICVDNIAVDVVGGHAGLAVPLTSQLGERVVSCYVKLIGTRWINPNSLYVKGEMDIYLTPNEAKDIIKYIHMRGGNGSSILSAGHAIARFTLRILDGISRDNNTEKGEVNDEIIECAMVYSTVMSSITPLFASPCVFDKNGVKSVLPLPETLSPFERAAIKESAERIAIGAEMASKYVSNCHHLVTN